MRKTPVKSILQRYSVHFILVVLGAGITYLAYQEAIGLYVLSVLMFMGVNIILSTSLNLVNGNMGEFSCGHAGFMCVGAYVASILGVLLFAKDKIFGVPLLSPDLAVYCFPFIIIAGGIAAAFAGLLVALPSYKTRGDYLAIITIAANYIIISLIENLGAIGGSRGFMGMKKVVNAMNDVVDLPWMVIWVFIFTVFTVWILRRYNSSTFGKGVSAICQDEVAAEIMSVDTNKVKTITFMLSSGLAGIAGGLFAYIIGYVNPGSFNILKSTEVMVMVYLGGMASLSGAVMSAIFFTILLELLRPLQIIKWVIIPLVLIIVMQFRPEGIMGNRELSDIFPKLKRFYRFK
ncbi:MAG: branched-chain amino acid ABC transporter permease [Proteobacteria bacterium]|nr:branched-chain amino acid ABC transporter permease [Pseudomonadota bacterium]MBU1386405.1 branched-chain amino acid ABC transporter permease [Pseudomonadota bacterium]MBU1544516.1 branched-chain amino acid ABC transporter permease [Pseudomonadota bacterium]MBU2480110.1 branched-chain amino acid ABC transporter permease [Pseudomonadota bacterium]